MIAALLTCSRLHHRLNQMNNETDIAFHRKFTEVNLLGIILNVDREYILKWN